MSERKYILDNQDLKVVDHLGRWLSDADTFRVVSAYFSIYGYELLADDVDEVESVRFLFGDPSSVDYLDPGEKDYQSFWLVEDGLAPSRVLYQKPLAERCARWVGSSSVEIRKVLRARFLHGKMYLTDGPDGKGTSVVGSSNFTRSGLGGGKLSNIEINVADASPDARDEMRIWFDKMWTNDGLTEDAKPDVLEALGRLAREHPPELVYYKTLYELFQEEIERGDQVLADVHLGDTQVWNKLFEFQKVGVRNVLSRLKEHNGCILADSVGLGKTYTALAVIKYHELLGDRVLVMCPKKLENNWALYSDRENLPGNPFPRDRFGYRLKAHTDLSREEAFVWSNYDLVVIDESHHFRNTGQRYRRFMDETIQQGINTKVLMLSATPVNTSLTDLRNQIRLMTGEDDRSFDRKLGITSLSRLLGDAQREYKKWEKRAKSHTGQGVHSAKSALLERLDPDVTRLLDAVSIARSRHQIEKFYSQDIDNFGPFPETDQPETHYPDTDLDGELSYDDLAEQIGNFTLAVYRPSAYPADKEPRQPDGNDWRAGNQAENNLVQMLRTNFLKRLESSAHSLKETLDRTISKIDARIGRIEQFQAGHTTDTHIGDIRPDTDEDDETFFVDRRRNPIDMRDLDLDRWLTDLRHDRATLHAAYTKVAAVTVERDGKLRALKDIIRAKASRPRTDRHGRPNRKLLVFTTFTDTAKYLYDNLAGLAEALGIHIAMVSGTETRTTVGRNDFNSILTSFAPLGRDAPDTDPAAQVDLLIGTDCISEGQNLQDCDTVLNYDIHWNPVRLIQRLGRITRIGSPNDRVRMINFWPTKDIDQYLDLVGRVTARMTLADIAATGDADPLAGDDEDGQLEFDFRDEQILRDLRDGVVNFDDLDDMPSMSDFTLNYFYDQLLRYLRQNKDRLERIEAGAYAVTDTGASHHPGVVFVLRQREDSTAGGAGRQQSASPVHPFYLVYVGDDGSIRYGCASTHQLLAAFEAVTADRTAPLAALCRQFNEETDNGQDMDRYSGLLDAAIAHIGEAYNKTQAERMATRRGYQLPTLAEGHNSPGRYELVTWLIITNPQNPSAERSSP